MIITLHKLIFSVNTPWLIYCSSTEPRIFVWPTSFKLVLFYAILDLYDHVRAKGGFLLSLPFPFSLRTHIHVKQDYH